MIVKCVLGVIGSWGAVLGCSETSRGDAAAVWRGYSVEATRGDAAATTWNFGWLGPVHANVMYGGDVDKDAHDITWFYAGDGTPKDWAPLTPAVASGRGQACAVKARGGRAPRTRS